MIKWYCSTQLQSYNAIFNFVIAVRNNGKTTALKMRSLKRFLKRGKKTIWVRRFKNEIKQTKKNFYKEAVLKAYGFKKENIYIKGNYVYYKDDKINDWFIQLIPLSSQQDEKSNDDDRVDTIVFDEFTTTSTRYKRYRGDEVVDFLDLWTSKKRWNIVKCWFLGNKETTTSPYLNYFGIPPLPVDFDGFKTYKSGTIAIQQINNINDIKQAKQNDFNAKVDIMLDGTSYGAYLNDGDIKCINRNLLKRTPSKAIMYRCFNINGIELSLYKHDGILYVKRGIDRNKQILSLEPLHQYKNNYVLHHNDIKYMQDVVSAYKFNSLFYNDEVSQEAFTEVLRLLCLI